MTAPRVHLIDWWSQRAALEPFFADHGGVVHVRASNAAPSSTFAKAIRRWMGEGDWGHEWVSIQIDADNANTHYLVDVIVQLEHSLQMDPDDGLSPTDPLVSVATNLGAGGPIDISNISVSVTGDQLTFATQQHKRVERIGDTIRAAYPQKRVALIFVTTHQTQPQILSRLHAAVWEPVLSDLVSSSGLLVIDIFDPVSQLSDAWPPEADRVLDLPERHEGTARDHAAQDLAAIVRSSGHADTDERARTMADTLIAGSRDTRQLHSLVSSFLAGYSAE